MHVSICTTYILFYLTWYNILLVLGMNSLYVSVLNFVKNSLMCYHNSWIFELCHIFKRSIIWFYMTVMILSSSFGMWHENMPKSCFAFACRLSSLFNPTGWMVWDQIPVGMRFFACPDRPWGPPSLCKMGTGFFLGVKCGRGVLLTTHRFLVPQSEE